MKLKVAHSSGQFSDTERQQSADARTLINQFAKRGWAWCSGTEANKASVLGSTLRLLALDNGFAYHQPGGTVWNIHPKSLFTGPVEAQWIKVVDATSRFGARGVLRVTGDCPAVKSDLTILVAHYCPEGAPGQRYYDANKRIAHKIGDIGRAYGKGASLVFYSGDQNIPDGRYDTFMGQPFKSMGDELHVHPDTGHGSIDVIASYNYDTRVSAESFRALGDTVIPMHTDHKIIEGVFNVKDPQ